MNLCRVNMKFVVSLLTVFALVNPGFSSQCSTWAQQKAIVNLQGNGVQGSLTLTQEAPEENVQISGSIMNGTDGYHGLHVHQYGDLSSPCGSTGGHFNPNDKPHGKHVGDLGNVFCQGGTCAVKIDNSRISLFAGALSVIGRGVVFHAKEDDLVNMASSGSRVACGVIGIAAA